MRSGRIDLGNPGDLQHCGVDVLRQRVERIEDIRAALRDLRDERPQPRHVRSWEGDRTRLEGSNDRLEVGALRRVLVHADPD